jgi:hypothetical protein
VYLDALLGQDITNVHLAASMVAPSLSPQLRCMSCKRFADGSDDTLVFGQQLPHKLESDASARAQNKPCGEILIGI